MNDLIAERLKDAEALLNMRHTCGNGPRCEQCRNIISARLLDYYRRGVQDAHDEMRQEEMSRQ